MGSGWNWTGAAAGAGIGTAVAPGPGTAIGFLGGGLVGGNLGGSLGLPDPLGGMMSGPSYTTPKKSDFNYGGMGEGSLQASGRYLYNQDRESGQQDLDRFRQSRAAMQQQAEQFGAMARDPNQSAALQATRMGMDQGLSNALALAGSSRGGAAGQAAALRGAEMQNAASSQQALSSGAIARMQEQQALLGQQAQLTAQGAGLDTQTALAQFGLGQQGMMGMYGLGQNAAIAQQQGMENYWKTRLGAEAAANQAEAQQKAGIMGAAGTIGAASILSDERNKMNIYPVGNPYPAGNPYLASSGISDKTDVAPIGAQIGMMNPGAGFTPIGAQFGGLPSQAGANAVGQYDMDRPMFEARDQAQAKSNFDMAQNIGGALGGIYGGQKIPGELMAPEQYLSTLSDVRAKELEKKNSALETALEYWTGSPSKEAVRNARYATSPLQITAEEYGGDAGAATKPPAALQHLPIPTAKSRVHDELTALEYGKRWTEANRQAAMADAAAAQTYQERVAAAQAGLDRTQRMVPQTMAINESGLYGQPVMDPRRVTSGGVVAPSPVFSPAAPYQATSDERSKQQIAKLEGIIAGLGGGGRYMDLDQPSYPKPQQPGSVGRMPDVPAPMHFAPREEAAYRGAGGGLIDQAAATPSYSWRYKPEAAMQANLRNGLPPTAAFGEMPKVGPMAQDLARNPATAGTVSRGPDGMLRVDGGQLALTDFALTSELSKALQHQEGRIQELESGRRKVKYPKVGGTGGL